MDAPAVREAERFTIETTVKKGIAPRPEISRPDHTKRNLETRPPRPRA